MCRGFLLALIFVVFPFVPLPGASNGTQSMTIVRAEQKTRDKVVYYVVNTPLYREEPYFEVEVNAGRLRLTGEYEPRLSFEMLPEPWKSGATVQGRVQGHHLYLKRPNGTELNFVITRRTQAPAHGLGPSN